MNTQFSADFFAGNRKRLRELYEGNAPIVITGNGRMQQAGTEGYPFHQDRNFWYLTGVDDPEVVLVMQGSKEYLILPELSDAQSIFDGTPDNQRLSQISGINKIFSEKEGWQRLRKALGQSKQVATFLANPKYIESFGIYSNPARAELISKLQSTNPNMKIVDIRPQLMRMRMVKQGVELKALQQAIDITIDSFEDTLKSTALENYQYEYEIEAELARGFRMRGAEGHAFTPIVAGGKRGCTLHYVQNNSLLKKNELVVLDVGASYAHYAADITRTIALQEPTKRQLEIHKAVSDAVDYACSRLKPGVFLRQSELDMEQFVGNKLRELGLIKKVEHDEVRHYFPHSTSHFLGLDTHDVGDYEQPLEPGVVITVEPGIYVPEEGIGVRIEEDVLITKTGVKVLSKRLPRDLYKG